MMPVLTTPLALVGLAALPAVAAIYWLRNRYRRQMVSSLMLWADFSAAREGGTKMQRFQSPLLLWLELLAMAMLALAAAGPHMLRGTARQPLVVILDDSYSMQAGGDDAPRRLAAAALQRQLDSGRYTVRLILAGVSPQLLLGPTADRAAITQTLDAGWRCLSPRADLPRSLALATELGGSTAQILVLTDRAPPSDDPISAGRVQWWAMGRNRPNAAFTSASRSADDRCLLELTNFSDQPADLVLTLAALDAAGKPARAIERKPLQLAAREHRALFVKLPPGTPGIEASIGGDALAVDNRVILLPEPRRIVNVANRVASPALRPLIGRALAAIPSVVQTADPADLVLTDSAAPPVHDGRAWTLRIESGAKPAAYLGPFVLDRSHPLTDGLEMEGVIWAAAATPPQAAPPGRPLVMAGNEVLLADAATPTGGHELTLRFVPELSTLQQSPNWPILLWNLASWRAGHLPGVLRTNLRIPEPIRAVLDRPVKEITLIGPGGAARQVPGGDVTLPVTAPGIWELRAGGEPYRFAANLMDGRESDLSGCASGRWGAWSDTTIFRLEYGSVAWVFGLAGLALLCGHQMLIWSGARSGGERL